MFSISSSSNQLDLDYTSRPNNLKRKQTDVEFKEAPPPSISNLFNTLLNRQIGHSYASVSAKFRQYQVLPPLLSPASMAFQLSVKNITKKNFSTSDIKSDWADDFTLYQMDNGESKAITLTTSHHLSMSQSRIQIFCLQSMKKEYEILVPHSVRKILSLSQNVLTFTYSSPNIRKLGFYSLLNKKLIEISLDGNISKSFNFINACSVGRRIFLFGKEELHEYIDEKLQLIDSNKIPPGLMDRHYNDTFICMGFSSFIIRANGEKIAITDLRNLASNQVIKINSLIVQWISIHDLSLNREEDEVIRIPCQKRERLSRSTSSTSETNQDANTLSTFPETKRSCTTYYLAEELLYFGTIITKERIELGELSLNTKKIVRMFFPEPRIGRIKPLKKIIVCNAKKWLCYGDIRGELGVIHLKNGRSGYLGSHEDKHRISTLAKFETGINNLCISHDLLVSYKQKNFKIWNLATLQLIYNFEGENCSAPFFYGHALFFHTIAPRSISTPRMTKYDFPVPKLEIEIFEENEEECAPTPILRTFSESKEPG